MDFDRTDYTLIKQALGMEKPAEGWTDTDTAFEVEHPGMNIPSSIDAPRDEFTYQRQRDDIAAGYKKKLRNSRIKLIFTAFAALALLFIECLPTLGVATPDVFDRGYYPVVWSMATLQLMLCAGALCYREIVNGTLGIFRGKLTGGGVLAIFILLSTVCDIVSCVGGAATEVYNFSAALCAVAVRLFDYADLRRESMAFEIASAPGKGKYVAAHMSAEETARIGGDAGALRREVRLCRELFCPHRETARRRFYNQPLSRARDAGGGADCRCVRCRKRRRRALRRVHL